MSFLTAEEAASRLGLAVVTVRTMARDGRLPRLKSVRVLRIPEAAIEQLEAEAMEGSLMAGGSGAGRSSTTR